MAISQDHLNALIAKGFDPEKMSKYESAIFLLQNMSNTLRLEYDEYMKSWGFKGKSSEMTFKINRDTKTYLEHVRSMIHESQEQNFFIDYEGFDAQFREFAKIEDLQEKDTNKLNNKELCLN